MSSWPLLIQYWRSPGVDVDERGALRAGEQLRVDSLMEVEQEIGAPHDLLRRALCHPHELRLEGLAALALRHVQNRPVRDPEPRERPVQQFRLLDRRGIDPSQPGPGCSSRSSQCTSQPIACRPSAYCRYTQKLPARSRNFVVLKGDITTVVTAEAPRERWRAGCLARRAELRPWDHRAWQARSPARPRTTTRGHRPRSPGGSRAR